MRTLFLFLSLILLSPVWAKVETAALFISLSDAMEAVKTGNPPQAQPHLNELQSAFKAIPTHTSNAGQSVSKALSEAKSNPNDQTFEQLSKALRAFEKEQNPVDYAAQRLQFAKRVMPVYRQLSNAVQHRDLTEIQNSYKRFNTTWTVNEKAVRETDLSRYGQIETAMALLRVAMLAEPTDFAEMAKQTSQLGIALEAFKAGQPAIESSETGETVGHLSDGIRLLEKGLAALQAGNLEEGKNRLLQFVGQWPVFEGEVRTRDAVLYTRVETELPLIAAQASDADQQQNLHALITELNLINTDKQYGMLDAMLILLREGIEALLIILALLTTLNIANQPKAKAWVFTGAGLGVAASLLGAIALQQLFPVMTAGTQREILEGIVGIIAVLMMLFVGAWLHNKSSLKGWQHFLNTHLNRALAGGSLFSMATLSFLSVFREGAETILFYAGMLPLMSTRDLLLGIGAALLLLLLFAVIMQKSSRKLPIPQLFKLMTLLIYGLGFKILGVSINALQLTDTLPRHFISALPNIPEFGLYASVEGLSAQLVYLFLIPLVAKYFK